MVATIIGIRADQNMFHIPCAVRVYSNMRIYLAMYPEVYEYPLPVYDDSGVVCNSYPGYRVSPDQKDFSDGIITAIFDDDTDYAPQLCGYPLCQYLVDGTDVVPEDVWRTRQDQRMPRYTLRYTSHLRKLSFEGFESGVVLEDCPIEELDTHIAGFRQTYGSEPLIYIGGNNLEPLAIYTTPVSQRPLKVVSRTCADQITCDWDERCSLPFRYMTPVWETVVLLRAPSLKDIPSSVLLPLPLCKRLHDMLLERFIAKAEVEPYVDHPKIEFGVDAVRIAFRRSREKAALIVFPSYFSLEAIAQQVARQLQFASVTAQEFRQDGWNAAHEMRGLVVYGYEPPLTDDASPSRSLTSEWSTLLHMESRLRAYVNTTGKGLVVLTNHLPASVLFSDARYPWANGPFGDICWTLRTDPRGESLLQPLQAGSLDRPGWKELETGLI